MLAFATGPGKIKLDADPGTAEKTVKSFIDQVSKNLNGVKIDFDTAPGQKDLDDLGKKVDDLGKRGGGLGKLFQFNQIAQAGQQISGALATLSQPFVALDDATAQLRTLGAEAAAIAPNLRTAAISMSKELPFEAAELQTTMFDALASGVKGGEEGLKSFAQVSAKLAVGGAAEIGQSTSLLAGQLNAYGKSAEDAGKFSDIFFNTVNFGVTSIPELSATLSNVIPTAASLGIEIENVGASLAVMTSKGVPTAQSTTKLNALLLELAKPGKALEPILKKAGVSLASLKQDDLPVTLGKVKKALEETGQTAIGAFSSSEASAGFNVLAGDLAGFAQTFKDVRDTTGSADNAYKEMAASVKVQTQQMLTSVNAFIIQGLDFLGPGFVGVVQAAAQLGPLVTTLGGLGSIIPDGLGQKVLSLGKNILGFLVPGLFAQTAATAGNATATAASAAAAGIDAAAKVGEAAATEAATVAQTELNVAMALNPVGAIILAIIGLVALLVVLYNTVDPVREAIDSAWASITEFAVSVYNAVLPVLLQLWEVIKVVGEIIGTVFLVYIDLAVMEAKLLWAVISTLAGVLFDVATSIGEFVLGLFGVDTAGTAATSTLDSIKGGLATLQQWLQTARDWIEQMRERMQVMADTVLSYVEPALETIGDILRVVADILGAVIVPVIQVTIDILAFLIGVIIDVGAFVVKAVIFPFQQAYTAISNIITAIGKFIAESTFLQNVFRTIGEWWDKVIAAFKLGYQTIADVAKGFEAFKDSAKAAIADLLQLDIKGFFDNILNGINNARQEANRLRFEEGRRNLNEVALAGGKLYFDTITKILDNAREKLKTATGTEAENLIKGARQSVDDLQDAFERANKTGLGVRDPKAYQAVLDQFEKLRTAALELKAIEATPAKSEAPASSPKPKEEETKPNVLDFTADAERAAQEAANIARSLEAKAAEEGLARLRAEAVEKQRLVNQDIDNQKKANQTKLDDARARLKKGQQLEVKGFDEVQTNLETLRAQRLRQARADEAKLIEDLIAKESDSGLKKRIDLLKEEENAITTEGERGIRLRFEKRQEQLALGFQLELQTVAREIPSVRQALTDLDREYVDGKLTPDDYAARVRSILSGAVPTITGFQERLASSAKALLDGTIKPSDYRQAVIDAVNAALAAVGDVDPKIRAAIQAAGAAAIKGTLSDAKALREQRLRDEEAAIDLIADEQERALARAELDARRAHEEELDRLQETEDRFREVLANTTDPAERKRLSDLILAIDQARIRAQMDLEARLYDLRLDYLNRTNTAHKIANAIRVGIERATTHQISEEERKRLQDDKTKTAESLQDLNEQRAAGLIGLKEYNQQAAGLQKQLAGLTKQLEGEKLDATQRVIVGIKAAMQDYRDNEQTGLRASYKETVSTYEKRSKASVDLAKGEGASFTEVLSLAGDASLDLAVNQGQALLTTTGELLADMITTGKFAWDTLGHVAAQTAIDTVRSLIDIFTPQILTACISFLGPIAGPIASAALIALVKGGLSLIKAKDGASRVPGNPADGDSVPYLLQPGERVVRERTNREFYDVFESIEKGRRLEAAIALAPEFGARLSIMEARRQHHHLSRIMVTPDGALTEEVITTAVDRRLRAMGISSDRPAESEDDRHEAVMESESATIRRNTAVTAAEVEKSRKVNEALLREMLRRRPVKKT